MRKGPRINRAASSSIAISTATHVALAHAQYRSVKDKIVTTDLHGSNWLSCERFGFRTTSEVTRLFV